MMVEWMEIVLYVARRQLSVAYIIGAVLCADVAAVLCHLHHSYCAICRPGGSL